MPAETTNGAPYPEPSDPNDIPGDLQRLAEWADENLAAGAALNDGTMAAALNLEGGSFRTGLEATIEEEVYPAAVGMPAPTSQAVVPIARQAGDGRNAALWEYIHNGTGGVGGYIYHWLVGASSGPGDWIVGLGVDSGLGNGIIIRNKAKGIGLKVEMLDTISSATAYGLNVEQKSSIAPAVSMSQRDNGSAPLAESFSFINDASDTAVMARWTAYAKPAGEIRSTSGKLVWSQNIEVVDKSVDVRDGNTVPVGDRYRVKHNPRNLTFHSLAATGSWYGHRIENSGSQFRLQVAAPSADPDAATYLTLINLRAVSGGQLSFFGATATRKTGWAVPTGTKTRTAFSSDSVTLPELAARVAALIDDLHQTAGYGLLLT